MAPKGKAVAKEANGNRGPGGSKEKEERHLDTTVDKTRPQRPAASRVAPRTGANGNENKANPKQKMEAKKAAKPQAKKRWSDD
jgi:hypothetical protein